MKRLTVLIAASTGIAGLLLLMPAPSVAQTSRPEIEAIVHDYLATHPQEVGEIVKDYLIKNPNALREVLLALAKQRTPAKTSAIASENAGALAQPNAAVKSNSALLFGSPHQVTLGNPDGDVTMVEFFDYNCGFCKRALPDLMTLIGGDPKLRIVLKEFPILGPGSTEAARVAIAVRMQDPDGQKYLAFHQRLLGSPGPANGDKAIAVARELGLDMARLESDMGSDEVGATIEENARLARAIGVSGTPSYVIADAVVAGAVGASALKSELESARARAN